jgi:hypothetical protein
MVLFKPDFKRTTTQMVTMVLILLIISLGVYIRALCSGLTKVLDEYRKTIYKIQKKSLEEQESLTTADLQLMLEQVEISSII